MGHEFPTPVILTVEFTDGQSTKLARVVEIKSMAQGHVMAVFGKDQGGEPELMAKYKFAQIRGWFVNSKLEN